MTSSHRHPNGDRPTDDRAARLPGRGSATIGESGRTPMHLDPSAVEHRRGAVFRPPFASGAPTLALT